jgi:hypothetical protein
LAGTGRPALILVYSTAGRSLPLPPKLLVLTSQFCPQLDSEILRPIYSTIKSILKAGVELESP